ncbi:histone-lysine N-methyltransferase SMYD3 isoform X5 [Leguminivora glycinivorella]|uniref:histone-lysine N-methyltransferase SMYD3 isoform X3 n=1 Tax=Leguminivora glycinivorella TaxID=1035111 RepID=UPI00200E0ACD|nr:histone-lysine N-methyltransferase SMYD3 isoform X3 [Leguminivora glycinivorella]XP_048006440.1 histone-lysine N-methyltransferase SMYD3 isoform X5 [Leguminivora glycinivorella]
MLAKIISLLTRGDGNSHRSFYSATGFRMWKDLMSHYSDLKADKKRMEHFSTLCVVLFEFLRDISLPNTVELMGIYGRMVINSFTILDTDMNSIGTGVYLASSIVDHSCNPNAVATFDGKTINLRALTDLPCLDWDQIRISYIDLMYTPYERQTDLLENYYFLCQCERCLDETHIRTVHAAKCLNLECKNTVNIPWKGYPLVRKDSKHENGGSVNGDSVNRDGVNGDIVNGENGVEDLADDIRCDECGTKFTENRVKDFQRAMDITEVHLKVMKDAAVAYVDICQYCLSRQGALHPLNVLRAQTLDHAFDALVLVRLWERARDIAELLLPCFRFYYGERHPLLGILHLKYGKILLYQMDMPKALEHFKSAEKILKITHGDKHPLYREQLMPIMRQAMLESSS